MADECVHSGIRGTMKYGLRAGNGALASRRLGGDFAPVGLVLDVKVLLGMNIFGNADQWLGLRWRCIRFRAFETLP